MDSFPRGGRAVVIGAAGAIGHALSERLRGSCAFADIVEMSRRGTPALDITDEAAVRDAFSPLATDGVPLRLVIDATGFLHGAGFTPERSWRQIDAAHLAHAFAVNAIGPALLMKHALPLLARDGKAVFAALSARVGSIGDNRLGGWYAYRASKAALNQLVRTAAVELRRARREAICVALHPGTVESALSAPFGKHGLVVRAPDAAAALLLDVIDRLTPAQSGGFLDYRGDTVPW